MSILIRFSFEQELSFGSGSGSYEIDVIGREFIRLSEEEYLKLLQIKLRYEWSSETGKTKVQMERIEDPDLIERIRGFERYFSTHFIYENILDGREYYEKYLKPIYDVSNFDTQNLKSKKKAKKFYDLCENVPLTKEVVQKIVEVIRINGWSRHKIIKKLCRKYPEYISLFDVQNLPLDASRWKILNSFYGLCNNLEEWTEEVHQKLIEIMKVEGFLDEKIVKRFAREFPQDCSMIQLIICEDYDCIDLLLDFGREVDEIDDWSEEWNLLFYICKLEYTEKRFEAVKHLIERGSNPNIILDGRPLKDLAKEFEIDPRFLALLN